MYDVKISRDLCVTLAAVLAAVAAGARWCVCRADEASRLYVASPENGRTLVVEDSEAGWVVRGYRDELEVPETYANDRYGFAITRPSSEWLVHTADSGGVVVANPDVAVEFVNPSGWAFVVVIMQRAVGDVEELSRAALDAATSRLETAGSVRVEETTLSGQPAVVAEFSGTYDALAYRFKVACIKAPGRFFQVCCFCPSAAFAANAAEFDRCISSVSVRTRPIEDARPEPARPAALEDDRPNEGASGESQETSPLPEEAE